MSGGGDVRVLRQEAGQESPRMPAWKREILERRKAKGGASGGAETANGTGPATPNLNGGGGGGRESPTSRNHTAAGQQQHFANNKGTADAGRPESLVLQESLGPLEENPFIKQEKERRRRQDQENAARPVQHILELYGSVPGIRTIRADNIIIIESDPDYFPDQDARKSGHNNHWQQNGVSSYSSLNDLLDRRGSAVTEIRAQEVVIYDTTLSKSEENLSTLGGGGEDALYGAGAGQGRVSRMLQKFDCNYGKLQKKSHSTENLLDLDSGGGNRPRLRPKPRQDLVPKPAFQRQWLSELKPKPKSPVPDSGGSSRRDEPDKGRSTPDPESTVSPHVVVPCSPTEGRRSQSELSPSHSSKMSRSTPAFEFRPSPKPDFTQIPDGDAQAMALANLRLQSRNSFTVIPKRRLQSSSSAASGGAANTTPSSGPVKSPPSQRGLDPKGHPSAPTSVTLPKQEKIEPVRDKTPPKSDPPLSPTVAPYTPSPGLALSPPSPVVARPDTTLPTSPPPAEPQQPPSPAPSTPPPVDHLPITNIDDIEVDRLPVPSPSVQRRKGNTFTVVPKRRGESEAGAPSSPEPPQQDETPAGTPTQGAPYTQLGTLLKKRYPAVEEIEVLGGYLSLSKSCLSKMGSAGKKLNISFNESSLHSTYEYPSETSTWDGGEEDEEGRADLKVPEELPSMVGRIHIPRAGFSSSPNSNGNDLSNYVPKHSVDFSAWQEYKQEDSVYQEVAVAQETLITEEVMLTPADSSSLSDYSSEPALYF